MSEKNRIFLQFPAIFYFILPPPHCKKASIIYVYKKEHLCRCPFFCNEAYAISIVYCNPSIHSARSSSDAPPSSRSPESHVPLPACTARLSPLLPIPLPPDVQKGITVIPSKLWLSTKVLTMRGASPPPPHTHTILRNQIDTIGYRFMSMRKRPWLGRFSWWGLHPLRCSYRFLSRDCIFFVGL